MYLGVSWWASWYPGAEPGGGGYVAQRIFSAKTEREAVAVEPLVMRGEGVGSAGWQRHRVDEGGGDARNISVE